MIAQDQLHDLLGGYIVRVRRTHSSFASTIGTDKGRIIGQYGSAEKRPSRAILLGIVMDEDCTRTLVSTPIIRALRSTAG